MFINLVCHFPFVFLFFHKSKGFDKTCKCDQSRQRDFEMPLSYILSCDKLSVCTCTKYFRPYLGASTGSIFMVYIMMIMNEKRN